MDFRSSKRTRSSSRRTVNDCSPKVSEHHPKGDADLKTENTQKKTGKRKVVRRLRSVQLANLVDDPKKPRTPCTTIGRKRVVGDTTVSRRPLFADVESGNNVNFSTPPARSPIPTMQRYTLCVDFAMIS